MIRLKGPKYVYAHVLLSKFKSNKNNTLWRRKLHYVLNVSFYYFKQNKTHVVKSNQTYQYSVEYEITKGGHNRLPYEKYLAIILYRGVNSADMSTNVKVNHFNSNTI